MKKKILFVIPNLGAGGAEKSLINLLNSFDFNTYEVDLLLTHKSGIFLEMVPKEVNILDVPKYYDIFSKQLFVALKGLVSSGRLDLFFYKTLFTINNRLQRNKLKAEQNNWKFVKYFFADIEKEYDTAIGYLEKTSNYIVIDCIKAKNKIGYIHNDYNAMGMSPKVDNYFFGKLKFIVTVSEECVLSLRKTFPQYEKKIKLIKNFIPKKYLYDLSKEQQQEGLLNSKYILSIGRLTEQKAFDKAIEAFALLVEKYPDLEWLVLGEGNLRTELEHQIEEKKLQNRFHLLGSVENPYPFIKNCLIFVQTSIFEGKSIAIDEAKIFAKPIVVTNYPSAKDQIVDGETGLIAEMDPHDIANKIESLILDEQLGNILSENLRKEEHCDESEIEKLYKLIES